MPTALTDEVIELRARAATATAAATPAPVDPLRLLDEFQQSLGVTLCHLLDRLDELVRQERSWRARRALEQLRDETAETLLTLAAVREAADLVRYRRLRFDRALRALATDFGRLSDACAEVRLRGAVDDLPAALRTPVLRIAREALFDIGFDSRASVVVLTLSVEPTRLVLEMADDGIDLGQRRGLDGRAIGSPVTRLAVLVARVGGRLVILQGRPRGVRLRVVVPCTTEGPA